jgi:hypothetical protein
LRRHDGWLKINSVLPARWSSIRSSVTASARHQNQSINQIDPRA